MSVNRRKNKENVIYKHRCKASNDVIFWEKDSSEYFVFPLSFTQITNTCVYVYLHMYTHIHTHAKKQRKTKEVMKLGECMNMIYMKIYICDI